MVKSDLPEKELRAIDAALDRDNATLDHLVTDPDENARIWVAKAARPQDLDRLVTDPSPLVRAAVARYGRPIDRQKLQVDRKHPIARYLSTPSQ